MSIKPRYWQRILDGSKKFELRRRLPKLARDDIIVVYASAPEKALVGAFRVDRVLHACPYALWDSHSEHLGIARSDYLTYFAGADTAWAIEVSRPISLNTVPLQTLRQELPGFRPPQSFMYWSKCCLQSYAPVLAAESMRMTRGREQQRLPGV